MKEDIFDLIYLLKMLHDIGKKEEIIGNYSLYIDMEYPYEIIFEISETVTCSMFKKTVYKWYEERNQSLITLANDTIEEFYKLVMAYGQKHNFTKANNPYFREVENKLRSNFNFSYCIDYVNKIDIEPKRKYQNRFALIISEDGDVDMTGVAIGVVEMFEYFENAVFDLKRELGIDSISAQLEVAA